MTGSEGSGGSLAAAGRATIVLTGGTVIVQIIGFARQLFLAAEVGIASSLDALLIALAAPSALVAILSVGVTTAIVPAYAEAKGEIGIVAARRLVGVVFLWLGLAGLLMSIFLWMFAELVVTVTGPGLADTGSIDAAAGYLRQVAPLAFVTSMSAVLYATCQAERLFPALTVAMVANPLLALAVLVSFWDTLALEGLALGTLVGSLAGLAILAAATVTRRVHPLPRLYSRGLGLAGLVRHAAPLNLSSAILQVNEIVSRAIASLVLPGGVGALRYGSSIVRLPFGAIRPAYRTAIYPTLVHAAREPSGAALGDTTLRVLRYGLVFFVPLAGLTVAVAPIATAVLYDRGSFTEADLMLTAQIVAVSAPLIVAWTAHPTIVSALNARRMGTYLLVGGILTTTANISLTVVLGYLIGIVGIAMATTLSSIIVLTIQTRRLSRLEPDLSLAAIWQTLLRSMLAILPSVLAFGIPIWAGILDGDLAMRVVILVVAGVAGLTTYYHLARRFGVKEAGTIIAFGTSTVRYALRRLAVLTSRSS